MPSIAALSVAVAAALATVPASEPPDLDHLAAALLTEAEMPPGFTEPEMNDSPLGERTYGYALACRDTATTTSAWAYHRIFVRDGRSVTLSIGSPGARWARETVRKITDYPAACPEYTDTVNETEHRITRVRLTGTGPDAAAMADDWNTTWREGDPSWGRDVTAAVAQGDLVLTVAVDRYRSDPEFVTDTEFATIVAAAAGKLAAFPPDGVRRPAGCCG
ncbi:hypothetical protein [Actinoplanes subglobosus]|uniref:PknH-like extracellular domain-containing protein n=1 Tax=Actinoplanes subglobosus TaxID=1547892 RepID=A0ABV8J6Q0_9ACTN